MKPRFPIALAFLVIVATEEPVLVSSTAREARDRHLEHGAKLEREARDRHLEPADLEHGAKLEIRANGDVNAGGRAASLGPVHERGEEP